MNDLPNRKPNRLKDYDYSQNNAYFVTICTKDRHGLLGRILVGGGFHAAPDIELSEIGKESVRTIEYINTNYHNVRIDEYVIMPNHIHMIVFLTGGHGNPVTGGHGNPMAGGHGNPPLQDVIGRFKSFTTKKWNELYKTKTQEMWQRSFHDHIIRDETDYQNHLQYIDENPGKWAEDKYYNGE
ncbi:MAG TPA: hypothetical protein PK629_12375 [Oscillospiraceae bacterium]|nr:hypothetical protein [Oscillospiraceae bacterium]HPF56431.1 hypothetical protein [Clostridiales bacterium]HPK36569.1 hypothetical protein [Oscillospiraceae bacterium]HPR76764.1 hypothetical protein [Oscillospiraceae bacterium]